MGDLVLSLLGSKTVGLDQDDAMQRRCDLFFTYIFLYLRSLLVQVICVQTFTANVALPFWLKLLVFRPSGF